MLTIAKLTSAAGHAIRTHAVPAAIKLAEHAAYATATHVAVATVHSAVSRIHYSLQSRKADRDYTAALRDSGGAD